MTLTNGITRPTVGVCGLGAMGYGMATHLLSEGFDVMGYDVFPKSVERFVAAGGRAVSSPAEAARQCAIIYIMVQTAQQVDQVLFDSQTGVISGSKTETVIIVSSTVSPTYWKRITKDIRLDTPTPICHILDCPVSGGTPRAASGELSIFVSGDEEGQRIARPVLEALSAVIYPVPGGNGGGSKAKMCHQVMPEAEIALLAEIMAFAAKAGLNTKEVFDYVQENDGSSWINGNRIPHLLEGDNRIYSVVLNSAKDSSIITATGREIGYPVPLVAAAEQVYQECIHKGWTMMDDAHIARLYLPRFPDKYVCDMTSIPADAVGEEAKAIGIDFDTINDLFAGVHLAISAEAMGFTEAVGLDTTTMYDIISKAAGSNAQFVSGVPHMKKPNWSLADVPSSKEMHRRLVTAMEKASKLGMPLPLCSVASQRYALAFQNRS